jgi:hypothetical protein
MQRSSGGTRRTDIVFASLVSGGWGAAAVALVFLAIDTVRGDPFFTPSLMGSVTFLGAAAAAGTEVRVDLMALYTVLHFILFTAVGFAASTAYDRLAGPAGRPFALAGGLFAALTLGTVAVNALLVPGLFAVVGAAAIMAANALASVIMAWLVHRTLRAARPL